MGINWLLLLTSWWLCCGECVVVNVLWWVVVIVVDRPPGDGCSAWFNSARKASDDRARKCFACGVGIKNGVGIKTKWVLMLVLGVRVETVCSFVYYLLLMNLFYACNLLGIFAMTICNDSLLIMSFWFHLCTWGIEQDHTTDEYPPHNGSSAKGCAWVAAVGLPWRDVSPGGDERYFCQAVLLLVVLLLLEVVVAPAVSSNRTVHTTASCP